METRKRHDTAYPPTFTLSDKNGLINLSTANSITFYAKNLKTGTLKMTIACTANPDQVTHKGECTFTAATWSPTDVDTSGDYRVEVKVIWGTGAQATWPSDGYETLKILDDNDNA